MSINEENGSLTVTVVGEENSYISSVPLTYNSTDRVRTATTFSNYSQSCPQPAPARLHSTSTTPAAGSPWTAAHSFQNLFENPSIQSLIQTHDNADFERQEDPVEDPGVSSVFAEIQENVESTSDSTQPIFSSEEPPSFFRSLTVQQILTLVTLCLGNLSGAMFYSLLAPFFPIKVILFGICHI